MARIAAESVEYEEPKTADKLPRLKPRPPFRLTYHSTRWGWHPTRLRWFPVLGEQVIDPGVGGINEHKQTVLADAALKERGWTVLPVKPSEYLARIEVFGGTSDDPRYRYVTRWQSVITAGTRVIEEVDEDGYYAWIDTLIERGVIPAAPEEHVKDMVLGKARDVAERESTRASKTPAANRSAEIHAGVVAALETELGLDAPAPPQVVAKVKPDEAAPAAPPDVPVAKVKPPPAARPAKEKTDPKKAAAVAPPPAAPPAAAPPSENVVLKPKKEKPGHA